jgi:hypothetical protein
MKNDHIRYYWLGFIAAAAGIGWLIWLWRKQIEVTPKPLYISGRTTAYPMSAEIPEVPEKSEDNLSAIQGIGPAYASRLNDSGITTFSQLAAADTESLIEITGVTRWNPEDWKDQAREMASGS